MHTNLLPQEKVQIVLYRTFPESTANPAHPASFHDSGRSLLAISQKSGPIQSIYQRPSTASGLLMVVGFCFVFVFQTKRVKAVAQKQLFKILRHCKLVVSYKSKSAAITPSKYFLFLIFKIL